MNANLTSWLTFLGFFSCGMMLAAGVLLLIETRSPGEDRRNYRKIVLTAFGWLVGNGAVVLSPSYLPFLLNQVGEAPWAGGMAVVGYFTGCSIVICGGTIRILRRESSRQLLERWTTTPGMRHLTLDQCRIIDYRLVKCVGFNVIAKRMGMSIDDTENAFHSAMRALNRREHDGG